jgi:predicted Zn-dependent protease
MIGKKAVKNIVDLVLKESKADQVEVLIFNYDQALTRFANNYIHQNVNESNTGVSIRAIFGRKIGSASTNSLEPQKIRDTVHWAENIARYQKDNPDFDSLPKVNRRDYKKIDAYVPETARFSNIGRAEAAAVIISVAKSHGLTAFGSVSNGAAEIAVSNSRGTFAYAKNSDVFCNIVMSGENSSGYFQTGSRFVGKINFRKAAEAAAQKALKSRDPAAIKPGKYTTIFEPLAVQDLLSYLCYYTFNGKMYEEGRSFLSGKLGTKVMDSKITLLDNPFNMKGYPAAFDFEGVPKQRLHLVRSGVAENVVYDTLTATRAKKISTGHALPAPNPFGPVPMHIVMQGGDSSLEEMIKQTKKGILVTRFHYTNVIDPYKLVITGMTRDGTFLIEDGVINRGLKNLRFTENVIEALNRVSAITRKSELFPFEPGYGGRLAHGVFAPALKIDDFTFTSATEF